MTELAAIIARTEMATDEWLPVSMPLYARTAFDDRRALLDLLRRARQALSDVGECHGCIYTDDNAAEYAVLTELDALLPAGRGRADGRPAAADVLRVHARVHRGRA